MKGLCHFKKMFDMQRLKVSCLAGSKTSENFCMEISFLSTCRHQNIFNRIEYGYPNQTSDQRIIGPKPKKSHFLFFLICLKYSDCCQTLLSIFWSFKFLLYLHCKLLHVVIYLTSLQQQKTQISKTKNCLPYCYFLLP